MYVIPEISRKEAEDILSSRASLFPVRIKKRSAPPKRIELIHLPFYIFEVLVKRGEEEQKVSISLDGLLGSTLFFAREDMHYKDKVENPVCSFILSRSHAQKIAMEEYKWLLVEHGLRSKKMSWAEEVTEVRTIFYPFWVGYFQKKQAYDFKALDGVSGEVQGVKMRKVFLKAFRQVSEVKERCLL